MCKLLSTVGGMLDASTKSVKNFNNSGKQLTTKVGGLRAWKAAAGLGCRRHHSCQLRDFALGLITALFHHLVS